MSEAQTNIGEEESIRRRSRTAMMSAAATAPEYASINGMPPSKIQPVHWISTHMLGDCAAE